MGWFDRVFYSQYSNNWDDDVFRNIILGKIKKTDNLLDLGAGAGIIPQMNFRGKVFKVSGIDPDQRVVDNPYLDDGVVGVGENLPYANDSFDVVIADNVLEHFEKPDAVFSEVRRVLKRNGLFIAKTPNKSHYVPLIARLSPHWFHEYVNKFRGRKEADTFPTFYKANSANDIKHLASISGFDVIDINLIEGRPEYLRKIPVLNMIGLLYERIVNSCDLFSNFRVLLVIILKKR